MKTSARLHTTINAAGALAMSALLWGCANAADGGTGGSGGASVVVTAAQSGQTSTATGSVCAKDCSAVVTQQCQVAVCNDGSYLGSVGDCVVIAADKGTACDDGVFCTTGDTCDMGMCVGGPANDCGMTAPPCTDIQCDESTQTCVTAPSPDGGTCTGTDLCESGATCHAGVCKGSPKDCSQSPYAECNTMACNAQTGACDPTPDASKNGDTCALTGDLCQIDKTCTAGICGGGTTKDCSSLGAQCLLGVCDSANGACTTQAVAPGASCPSATDQCNAGTCNANGECHGSPLPTGTTCDDHRSCTTGDSCTAGSCDGTPVAAGCPTYFEERFETCPDGWQLNGGWACGHPTAGPSAAHGGTKVLSTGLDGNFPLSAEYTTVTADSPAINLTGATNPTLSFWVWSYTEQGNDGAIVEVSSDGGSTYSPVANLVPGYDGTVNNQPAWTGDNSAAGWRSYSADLTAYVGQHIRLRFAFASGSFNFGGTGVFIDDLTVSEAASIPLSITTASLPNAFATIPYAATLLRAGGSPSAVWSITGGVNDAWLTIDSATGALSGTPTAAQVGPVTVDVRVAQPTVPTNFATATFSFTVKPTPIYVQSFEGTCPDGWVLTGQWQCGVPSNVGPATANSGSQCIATVINGNYGDNDAFASTTATSPAISLVGATTPKMSFYAWVDTEGNTWDGFNFKVSTDGGTTFTTVTTVTPTYPLTLGTTPPQPAWGGHLGGSGWQLYQVDLSAFAGQSVLLQFAFRSDGSGNYPGVYIDDVTVF